MVNLRKRKKWPWEDWETYVMTGLISMMYVIVAFAVIMLMIAGFKEYTMITSIVTGFILLVVPVGYFVVHVIGWKVDA